MKINVADFNEKKRGLSDELSEDYDLNLVGLLYPDISVLIGSIRAIRLTR